MNWARAPQGLFVKWNEHVVVGGDAQFVKELSNRKDALEATWRPLERRAGGNVAAGCNFLPPVLRC